MRFLPDPATCLLAALLAGAPLFAGTIFSDDFESGALGDSSRWDTSLKDSTGGIETRLEFVHGGKRSLRTTALDRQGKSSGAGVTHWFMPGVDQCNFRWYAMFAGDFYQGDMLHWTIIGGSRVDDRWSCFTNTAGRKPDGTDFFVTNLEPNNNWSRIPPPGRLIFYSYFPEMKQDPDGHYWGNQIRPEEDFLVQRGRWYCFEVQVKLNQPGSHDGEQAFWIDGREIFRQTGIRWRDIEDLKLNSITLGPYIHQSRKNNTCWYDDVVIGTEYIGPLK